MDLKKFFINQNSKKQLKILTCGSVDDGKSTLWTFKLKRFTRKRDGGFTSGPLVVDSHNNLWNHDFLIGNGSKMIIAYAPSQPKIPL